MDIINELIVSKKKQIQQSQYKLPQKRRGKCETEVIKEDETLKCKYEKSGEEKKKRRMNPQFSLGVRNNSSKFVKNDSGDHLDEDENLLSRSNVIKLLRERKEPVTLFGETDRDRFRRLKKLESMALGSKELQKETGLAQYSLRPKDDDDEYEYGEAKFSTKEEIVDVASNSDRSNLTGSQRVICFIRQMLKEWKHSIDEKPSTEKLSTAGRNEFNAFDQCRQSLRPFLKLLKCDSVAPEILRKVESIVSLCEKREYLQAADLYIELAVGNEPWPIGVTNVGIHARKGRERINAENVAHVMNDEAQRRYITSIKRLMTFCQKQYPSDPSQMMQ